MTMVDLDAVIAAAPCTAQNPNISSYDRGFFDAVIAYQAAVKALPASNARIEAGVAMKAACVDALHTMARPATTLKPVMRAIVTAIEELDTAAIVGD
jgi:hypothetical protein